MTTLDVILLGLVEGITEFLPISSSGHLVILKNFLNLDTKSLSFDIALHLGAMLAIIIYFFKDIVFMLVEFFNLILLKKQPSKLFLQIIFATIPVVIFGLIVTQFNLHYYFRIIPIIGFNLIFFGIILYYADKKSPILYDLYQINNKKSFIIGLFQCLALIPGVSRSGICLSASRLMGIDKISAVKFSMLISIPSILGAGLLEFLHMQKDQFIYNDFALGFVVSFLSGIVIIRFLLNFLKKFDFKIFMIYRIILGSLLLLWYYM